MSTAATVAANAVTNNNSDSGEKTVSVQTATSLSQSVEKLAFAVIKLSLLTKDPTVQLREANEDKSDKDKMFISEDLTTVRKGLFFKTRTLKKQGHVKSTGR